MIDAKPAGICALDTPAPTGGQIEVPNTGVLEIRGWAFAQVGKPVPSQISMEILSEATRQSEIFPAHRVPRPDVSSHFADPGLVLSGFTAAIPLGVPRYGQYTVHLIQNSETGSYSNESILRFSVAPESYERSARSGLARKYLRGTGIEIGALQRKLEVPPGCIVRYVDRMSLDDLRAHYPELNGILLQAPDIVDDGERLTQFPDVSLDFVIANHFLEHCEDPASALGNFLRVLRSNGIVYMAIPDKRSTFDFTRPCTNWHVLKETFFSGTRCDRQQLYEEWAVHVMKYAGEVADQTAKKLADESYSIHFNVWDLEFLLDFLGHCRSELALPFRTSAVVSSENETIVVLERS